MIQTECRFTPQTCGAALERNNTATGDFDGDGEDKIAILYKRPYRAITLKNDKGWRDDSMTGDVNCRVYQWNANSNGGHFDYKETAKAYNKAELRDSATEFWSEAKVAGVIGLRTTAADLDGDGKSEIVTILLGYYHHKLWYSKANPAVAYGRYYPHIAVWTFNRSSIASQRQ